MTLTQALLLGIVQGITEFLPVSSSGHLTLLQYFFGFQSLDGFILFDLVLHLGTLCAIFAVFQTEILRLFGKDPSRFRQVVLGTLPLFPLAFILKPIESVFDKPEFFGLFFLVTAALLYAGIRFGYEKPPKERELSKWKDSLFIGLFQALAIFPGISRSGSTISAARLAGWSQSDAVTFSFLLAIPAILGGASLKTLQILTLKNDSLPPLGSLQYVAGFCAAFIVGYAALNLLIRLATKEKFMYFVWYCLALGAATSFYFLIKQ